MILSITVLIIMFCIMAYLRMSLSAATVITGLVLFTLAQLFALSPAWIIAGSVIFLTAAAALNVPFLRRRLFTDRMFRFFKKTLPAMSSTEQEAIQAGTVWWDGELFSGKPDWNKLLSMPTTELTPREQAFLDGPVEELCSMLDDWQINEELHDLPEEAWTFIKEKGFFGMIIPVKYGGLGFSTLAHSNVVMKLASRSVCAAVTVMVPNSLGPAELIHSYGTEKQKDYYLPRLARAEEIPCFALTGPQAGSDAASMPDTGIVCKGEFNGQKDVLGIRLNWDKRYITLGPIATVLGLAFKLFDPEHLMGNETKRGITLALIPTGLPGITIGSRHIALGSDFLVGPNWGKDVFIPVDMIIGGPARAGEGWRMLMDCLAEGRSVSLPALSNGSCKLSARVAGAYSHIRRQFNMPIGKFEGVEEALAKIGGYTYLADAARIMTASGVDQGEKPSVVSAIVKYYLTELSRKTVNHAMDVQGGAAICEGPRNLLAKIYQSVPVGITVEGANILTRSMIIFGQGMIRCHPYVIGEITAVNNEDLKRGKNEFDKAFIGHTGFIISNLVRSLFLGLTGGRLVTTPYLPRAKKYLQQLTSMSSAFAFAADVSMIVLGSSLKRRERLSARLADVLGHMYLASSAIKHFEDQGAMTEDLPLFDWASKYSLYEAQEALDGLIDNFPNRYAAGLMRVVIFPLGKRLAMPDDRNDHRVAELVMSDSESRDRLTDGIYIPDSMKEQLGLMEETLRKVIEAEAIEKKIKQALSDGALNIAHKGSELKEAVKAGIINSDEEVSVRTADLLRKEVVRVDDFSPEKMSRQNTNNAKPSGHISKTMAG
ncbi:MAG: acyl-CoA dehydrogenase [Nitrospira sp.]|nr:acyl-CoA dehydrogenase [bacterium]MBL7049154.1 acyl-CoA dehydrogenase [Nitrospira sp.]